MPSSRPGIPTAPGWFEELPPAIAEAKKSGKDILIDFGGSNWCLPCIFLKKKIFTTPEFFAKASPNFVLVDIDTLTDDRMPKDKLARYVALQKKYAVGSFPSVFLCTPDGEAYAWATYIPTITDPQRYWDYLKTSVIRGAKFREGLRKADTLKGTDKAAAMVDALSQVPAEFVWRYHADMVAQLRKLDPADGRGFLAYLASRKAYDAFTLSLKDDGAEKAYGDFVHSLKGLTAAQRADAWKRVGDRINPLAINPKVTVSDVDHLISKYNLTGETLQQALLIKAVIYTDNDQPSEALQCIRDVVAEDSHLGPYDNGQYFKLDPESKRAIQATMDSCQNPAVKSNAYLALHQIFENQLPDRFEVDCHATNDQDFRPSFVVRVPIKNQFEQAVQQESASLDEKARTDYVAKMEGAMRALDDVETARLRALAHG